MNKVLKENGMEMTNMVEDVSLDVLYIDDDIRDWVEIIQPISIKEYGVGEVSSEEEYFAVLNEMSDYLMER